ncbi:hypothetical protein V1478_015809 [Vespula squamosa]|uniref:Uncharacterized protein n=1 Tax=Vespula squamosa TaxID=30214 RepID=A0ABD2A1Y8_VESSQ
MYFSSLLLYSTLLYSTLLCYTLLYYTLLFSSSSFTMVGAMCFARPTAYGVALGAHFQAELHASSDPDPTIDVLRPRYAFRDSYFFYTDHEIVLNRFYNHLTGSCKEVTKEENGQAGRRRPPTGGGGGDGGGGGGGSGGRIASVLLRGSFGEVMVSWRAETESQQTLIV